MVIGGNIQGALASVDWAVEAEGTNAGYYPFVVMYNKKVIGLATLWQTPLMARSRLWRRILRRNNAVLVSGVQMAFWFGRVDDRNDAPRPLSPHVLALLRQEAQKRGLKEQLWTLARPAHSYMCDMLAENGFSPLCDKRGNRRTFLLPHVDGVAEPRVVYVS